MFTIFGLLFWLGSIFVRDNSEVSTEDMFIAVFSVLFAGTTIGNNTHFLPDTSTCKIAAANLFHIQDSEDEEQMQVREGSKLLKDGAVGDIALEDVNFKYESRNEYVFRHMNIRIKKGHKVAFVGTSGCGKSTIIQLVQRFYFPSHGLITMNNSDIKDFDIHYLRSVFGVVSQEPVLFNGTFAENIQYNLEGVTREQIEEAARQASAISFIMGTESTNLNTSIKGSGFDRDVGVRGSHISGGQKQRVAIARTILRNPQILLLDEATSALDSENEKKVQDSLDSIMQGKTVISVAHRIETIKNSDTIYMFEKGKIIESGSYNELIALKGHFYNL